MAIPEIQPSELAEFRTRFPDLVLLDVREVDEREVSVLPNDVHIPLGMIASKFGELDPNAPTVVYCRSGARSARVAGFLLDSGFKQVWNLARGINAYAVEVDPSLKPY